MNWQKFLFSGILFTTTAFAQDTTNITTSSVLKKSYQFLTHSFYKEVYGKNIVKYNPMATAVFSDVRNSTIGYERITGHNQSVSINVGALFIPRLISDDIGAISVTPKKQLGYIVTLDYRFYLQNHNKRPAPNGLYIGPFLSTYHNQGGADFSYIDEDNNSPFVYTAELKSRFSLYNLGFQLGYQFIFAKRISLDLILFGPAVSYYTTELELNSNLSADQADEFYQKYYDKIFSKFPIIDELVNRGSFKKDAYSTGILPNFRYAIQVGYHF